MSATKRPEIAIEIGKAFEKESGHFLVYAAALVVVHLLNIAPTELSALGAKFTLASPVILRGVIAILVLHKLHLLIMNARYYYAFGADKQNEIRLGRYMLKKHSKPGASFKVRKFWTRFERGVWMMLFAPYALTMVAFMLLATGLAAYDLVSFAKYCVDQAPGFEPIRQVLLIDSGETR